MCAVWAAACLFVSGNGPLQAFGKQSTVDLQDQPITVESTPIVHFEKAAPERTQFGKLEWRGGLVLSSASTFFGGWSGLTIDRDGKRFLSVSDSGVWLTGQFSYDGSRPTGLTEARIGALRGFDGKPFKSGKDRDSEGVTLIQGTLAHGEILVSFEQHHRILRFPVTADGVGMPSAALVLPHDARQLSSNKSLEAVCVLQAGPAKGAVLTFAERFPDRDKNHLGWMRPPLFGRVALANAKKEVVWTAVPILAVDGYDLTDCAGLPDGDLLLLERRYRVSYGDPIKGPRMRIRRIPQSELSIARPIPAPIAGETLLDVGTAYEIDNLEGLAVHTDAKGATVVTLISDDNFNSYLQRTVLLQFAFGTDQPADATAKERR